MLCSGSGTTISGWDHGERGVSGETTDLKNALSYVPLLCGTLATVGPTRILEMATDPLPKRTTVFPIGTLRPV